MTSTELPDFLTTARQVAAQFGATVDDRNGNRCVLIEPPGEPPFHLCSSDDRLEVSGHWPRLVYSNGRSDYYRPRDGGPRITVSAHRAPESIARDIMRRFLPPYRVAYTEQAARVARAEHAETAEQLAIADILGLHFGTYRDHYDHQQVHLPYKSGAPSGEIRISHSTTDGRTEATITIRYLDLDRAHAILNLVLGPQVQP